MPSCAVKWCRNRSDLHNKNAGIRYHVFPQNPSQKEQWTRAVCLERQENQWSPSKTTRICSVHFQDDDFYMSKKGYQKLKTDAIPICTMVLSSSTPKKLNPTEGQHKNVLSISKKYNNENVTENPRLVSFESNSLKYESESEFLNSFFIFYISCPNCGCKFDLIADSAAEDPLGTQIKSSILEVTELKADSNFPDRSVTPLTIPSFDTESTLNTPKTHKFKKQIKKQTLLSNKRLSKIRSLMRRKDRLIKQNISFKEIITTLKKNKFVDTSAHTSLAEY